MPLPRPWVTSVAVAAVLAVGVAGGLPAALAQDATPEATPTTLAQAQQRFDAAYAEAEQARARLARATLEAETISARLAAATASVQRQQTRVATMTAELGGFAAALYRAPVSDPAIELVVSDDPAEALAQSSQFGMLADQQVRALAEVAQARERLQRDRDDLAEQQAALDALTDEMEQEQARLAEATEQAKALLDRLAAEERRRLAELQARARQDADARTARSQTRADVSAATTSTVSGGAPGGSGCVVTDPTGTGGCVTPVMAWVYDQLRATFGSIPTSCWRGGGGDHAQGRACDIMFAPGGTYPGPEQTARGWQVAEWLRGNAGRLQVDYVIWQGRIWSQQRSAEGWRPYNGYGATGGHYDHVHVSVRR